MSTTHPQSTDIERLLREQNKILERIEAHLLARDARDEGRRKTRGDFLFLAYIVCVGPITWAALAGFWWLGSRLAGH